MIGDSDASAVSVVVATCDSSEALIASEQVWRDVASHCELVVQDGGSADGTVAHLSALADEGVISSFATAPDSGVYDAWNKALARCTGDWILFYGDADEIPREWITSLTKLYPDTADIVVGELWLVSEQGNVLGVEADWMPKTKSELFNYTRLPHVGLAHSRRLFESRNFDASFKIAGDRDLLLAAWPLRIRRLPGVSQGKMVLGGLSNSAEGLRRANYEDGVMLRRYGVRMTPWRYVKGLAKNLLSCSPTLWRTSRSVSDWMRSFLAG